MRSPRAGRHPIRLFFEARARRRAIKHLMTVFPRDLLEDYGHTGPFRPEQVQAALRRRNVVRPEYWPYALAIFCEKPDFDRLSHGCSATGAYERLRGEVAELHFRKPEFTQRDLDHFYESGFGLTADGGGYAHDGGHGGDGGGHH